MGAARAEGCLVGKKEAAGQGKCWGKRLHEQEDGEAKGEQIAPETSKETFLIFLSWQNPWNEDEGVYLR